MSSRFSDLFDNDAEMTVYQRSVRKKVLIMGACAILSILAVGLEVSVGKSGIGFFEAYSIIWDHLTGSVESDPGSISHDDIVWNLRVPRAIAAFFVGVVLAVCGAAMQSIMKNPLADPYTTGISSGASLGAVLYIGLGFCLVPGLIGSYAIVVNAFFFSLIPTAAIIFISKVKRASPTTMILAGLGVMYAFSSITSLLMLVIEPDNHKAAYMWNIGSIGAIEWSSLPFIIGASVIAFAFMQYMAKYINILAMNDAAAVSIGVDAKKVRSLVLIVTAFTVSLVVSFTGCIGFVGLIIPHIARIFVGSDNRYLIPASAMFGGTFLLYSDCIAKSVGVTGVPVGVITAALGGLLFLYIVFTQKKKIWG